MQYFSVKVQYADARLVCGIHPRPELSESRRQHSTRPGHTSSNLHKRALADDETSWPASKRATVKGKDHGSPCLESRLSPATSVKDPSPADDGWPLADEGQADNDLSLLDEHTTTVSWDQLDLSGTLSANTSSSGTFCVYHPIRSASVSTGDGQPTPISSNASFDPLPPTIPCRPIPHLEEEVVRSIPLNCVSLCRKLGGGCQEAQKVCVSKIVEGSETLAQRISELDFEGAIQVIQTHPDVENGGILSRCVESRYWDLVLREAGHLDPKILHKCKGPSDGFSQAQKEATKLLMTEIGLTATLRKQRECRKLWRLLYDMRNAGVNKILLYRTKRFDSFCKVPRTNTEASHTEIALRWEEIYGPHIALLEARVDEECDGGLSGRSWLQQPFIADRLHVPVASWNSTSNPWYSHAEQNSYGFASEFAEASTYAVGLSDLLTTCDAPSNKSIFIALLPRDERSLIVCPILTIEAEDFLGVFSGEIRHSEWFDHTHGIRGPGESIWLDYSRLTGTLNMMRVSMNENEANVRIQWGHYHEQDGRRAWWVSVRALRNIEPFEELTRHTEQAEQMRLHQDLDSARVGFRRFSSCSREA